MSSGWGGARRNTGPKAPGSEEADIQVRYDEERALHEKVKREQREFQLAVEKGEYLPREIQRQAASTALATLTQSLRSIPDNLERTLALQPVVVQSIAEQIDLALAELAQALRAMTNRG